MKAFVLLDSYKEKCFLAVAIILAETPGSIRSQLKAESGDYENELVIMDPDVIINLMSDFVAKRDQFLNLSDTNWSWIPSEHFFCLEKASEIEVFFRERCFWKEELPFITEDQRQLSLIPHPQPKIEFRGLRLKLRELPIFTQA